MERNRLHAEVGEADRRVGRNRDALDLQGFLKTHQAEPDRAMSEIGSSGLRDRVEVDIDDIVEHPHRGLDGALSLA